MQGLWIGMILGVVMQSLVLGYITFKTDWNDQVIQMYILQKPWSASIILIYMNIIRMTNAFRNPPFSFVCVLLGE